MIRFQHMGDLFRFRAMIMFTLSVGPVPVKERPIGDYRPGANYYTVPEGPA